MAAVAIPLSQDFEALQPTGWARPALLVFTPLLRSTVPKKATEKLTQFCREYGYSVSLAGWGTSSL
ncbi:hypothetical protein [Leptodesmis sichuanensis]|uniref:hypothetical protein n=1 Tax=Leptodesmis sichuanensis TaxID=2906798 RepID=UPI001F23DD11|nr:hypothetical protein [Leptodesmis sichuanensis]UIE37432.1 hypothetical protein KIK02_21225 [Leptodesmis sichuanensis A121]